MIDLRVSRLEIYAFILCLLIASLPVAPARAQEPGPLRPADERPVGSWQTFSREDGLGDNAVLAVWGDGQGAVWAGTRRGGLSCFDEETWEWTTFTTADGLASNDVQAVWGAPVAAKSELRIIWAGTDRGLSHAVFAGCAPWPEDEKGKRRWATFTTKDGLPSDDVRGVWGDGLGTVWVATGGGLGRWDGQEWRAFTTAAGLASDDVRGVWGDGQGTVWFATDKGLSRWDGQKWRTFTTADGLAADQVQAVWGEASGAVWVGTTGGVSYGGERGWRTFTREDGLASDNVRALWGDGRGVVWVGTAPVLLAGTWRGGVSRWDGREWQSFGVADGLGANSVWAIWGDGRERVWVGTVPIGLFKEKGGLSRYEERKWKAFVPHGGLGSDDIRVVWDNQQGVVWVGTRGGGLSRLAYAGDGEEWTLFTTADGLGSNEVWAIWALGGTVWVGTSGGLSRYDGEPFHRWTTFSEEDGLGSNFVRALWADSRGVVWAGTVPNPLSGAEGGLSRWDGREWKTFKTANALSIKEVWAVSGCSSGEEEVVWVGTRDRGLARTSRDGAEWTTFTANDGLASDYIYSVWCDTTPREGAGETVWVGTTAGLSRWDGQEWRTFTTADGLPSDDVRGVWGDGLGTVWVATGGGLGRWDGQEWRAFTTADGLASNDVRAVSAGPVGGWGGTVWAGTGGGLSRFGSASPGQTSEVSRTLGAYTLPSTWVANDVRAIWGDESGELWLGTTQGVSHYLPPENTGSAGEWQTFDQDYEISAMWVTPPATPDGQETAWVGTTEDGDLRRWDGWEWEIFSDVAALADNRVQALWAESGGTLWIGSDGGVICHEPSSDNWLSFTTADGLAADDVQALWGWEIAGTQRLEVWAGTAGGLSLLVADKGTCAPTEAGRQKPWTTFTRADGLGDNWVNAVWVDARGAVWAGTRNGGVSYFVPDRGSGVAPVQGEWATFDVADGLGSNNVSAIWGDERGTLWVGTRGGGLSRLDIGEYVGGFERQEEERPWRWRRTWMTFRRDNSSLTSNTVRAIWGASDGGILVGTDAWYERYEPAPPRITSLVVWAGEKLLACPARVDPGALGFFVMVDDTDLPPNDIAYRYKVEREGERQPWRFLENTGDEKRRLIPVGVTEPGHYVFSVAAGNIQFDWSEPVSCTFAVRDLVPPQVEIREVQISSQENKDFTPREVSMAPLPLEGRRTLTYTMAITDFHSPQGLKAYYRLAGAGEPEQGTFDPARPLILQQLGPGDYELAIWARDGAGEEEGQEQRPGWTGPGREGNESPTIRSSVSVPQPQYIGLWWVYTIVLVLALPIAVGSVYGYRRLRLRGRYAYNDLEVQLAPSSEPGTQTVRLLSPHREPTRATLPFDQALLQNALDDLARGVSDELALRYLGERLFNSLFGAELRGHIVGKAPLRLRLNFQSLPRLAVLPWEYLYGGEQLGFLGVSPDTALVRFLLTEGRERALRAVLPLKLLVVIASPRDHAQWELEPIDAEGEKKRLDEALEPLIADGKLQTPVYLEGCQASSDQLRNRLQEGFDIVHFICHGGVADGKGMLVLVDEHGDYLPITQEELATLFAGFVSEGVRAPKLVVLNACRTAGQTGGEELAGLAPELVLKGGLPAVVGMQYPIKDEAAKIFAAGFYTTLARYGQVDYAVSAGRKAIAVELDLDQRDWGCPVLYMQVRDGIIFEVL